MNKAAQRPARTERGPMFTNFSQMSTAFLNATGDARNKYEIQNAVGEADKLRPNLSEADIDRQAR